MRSSSWLDIIARIPRDLHGSLVMVTTIGQEFSLQAVVRLEQEYVVIRGRSAGTTDTGRVFFLPYDQINYVGFANEMKEEQVHAFYGDSPASAAAALVQPQALAEAAKPTPPPVDPSPAPSAATEPGGLGPTAKPKSSGRLAIPSRKALLDRLRLRNRSGSGSNPPQSSAP